jgi:uncharacterized protein
MEKKFLLAGIKKAIAERIGSDRLKGVFLFGSEARSTATKNSDIDILVILKGPVQFGSDLQEVISATYSMQLDIDQIIHFTIGDIRDYESGEFSLYRRIKNEGVAV